MSDRLDLGKERKIHEIRAKLLGVVERQKEISARLEVAMNHMKLCQTELVDYCSKRNLTTSGKDGSTDQALEAIIRQIRMLDLLGEDSFSKSDEEYVYEDISLGTLYEPDNYDLEQLKEDMKGTDAVPDVPDAVPGDTVRRNVTI